MAIKVGTSIGMLNPKYFVDVAVAADELGYESLWMPEHLVFPLSMAGSPHAAEEGDEYIAKTKDVTGIRAVGASFLVLFAAEWGDLSQLLTLTLVARYEDPVSVFIGALGALLAVSGLAVLLGRALLRVVPLHLLHYVGAGVCLLLAGITAYELVA